MKISILNTLILSLMLLLYPIIYFYTIFLNKSNNYTLNQKKRIK